MKALGELSHLTKSGKILLKGGAMPSLYSTVVTSKAKRVGRVVDVIGPVSNPYIVVKPLLKVSVKKLSSTRFYEATKRKRRRSVGGKKGRVY